MDSNLSLFGSSLEENDPDAPLSESSSLRSFSPEIDSGSEGGEAQRWLEKAVEGKSDPAASSGDNDGSKQTPNTSLEINADDSELLRTPRAAVHQVAEINPPSRLKREDTPKTVLTKTIAKGLQQNQSNPVVFSSDDENNPFTRWPREKLLQLTAAISTSSTHKHFEANWQNFVNTFSDLSFQTEKPKDSGLLQWLKDAHRGTTVKINNETLNMEGYATQFEKMWHPENYSSKEVNAQQAEFRLSLLSQILKKQLNINIQFQMNYETGFIAITASDEASKKYLPLFEAIEDTFMQNVQEIEHNLFDAILNYHFLAQQFPKFEGITTSPLDHSTTISFNLQTQEIIWQNDINGVSIVLTVGDDIYSLPLLLRSREMIEFEFDEEAKRWRAILSEIQSWREEKEKLQKLVLADFGSTPSSKPKGLNFDNFFQSNTAEMQYWTLYLGYILQNPDFNSSDFRAALSDLAQRDQAAKNVMGIITQLAVPSLENTNSLVGTPRTIEQRLTQRFAKRTAVLGFQEVPTQEQLSKELFFSWESKLQGDFKGFFSAQEAEKYLTTIEVFFERLALKIRKYFKEDLHGATYYMDLIAETLSIARSCFWQFFVKHAQKVQKQYTKHQTSYMQWKDLNDDKINWLEWWKRFHLTEQLKGSVNSLMATYINQLIPATENERRACNVLSVVDFFARPVEQLDDWQQKIWKKVLLKYRETFRVGSEDFCGNVEHNVSSLIEKCKNAKNLDELIPFWFELSAHFLLFLRLRNEKEKEFSKKIQKAYSVVKEKFEEQHQSRQKKMQKQIEKMASFASYSFENLSSQQKKIDALKTTFSILKTYGFISKNDPLYLEYKELKKRVKNLQIFQERVDQTPRSKTAGRDSMLASPSKAVPATLMFNQKCRRKSAVDSPGRPKTALSADPPARRALFGAIKPATLAANLDFNTPKPDLG